MPNRYDSIRIVTNEDEQYRNYFEQRGKKFIDHYVTPTLKSLNPNTKAKILKNSHIWSSGDKFFSVSVKYYNDPRYWWLIAWFNEKPTEQHVTLGEIIYVPMPLNVALSYYYGG